MNYHIEATKREELGRKAKQVRRDMKVPAVLYGNKIASTAITLGRTDFIKLLKSAGYSSLIDVTIDDAAPVKAVLKHVQVHPISMEPIHADFYQVDMNKEMEASVPLKFIGESRVVKEEGGTLVKTLDEIDIRCLPANLPALIEVDLSALKTFEDSISINDLKLPEGVEALEDNLTIVNVARPMTEEELKALEESQVGDVTGVVAEADEKKPEGEEETVAAPANDEATTTEEKKSS